MTTPSTLIERLEKATGPDRFLDWDIASLTGWTKETRNLENINGATEPVTLIFSPDDCGETRKDLWNEAQSLFAQNMFSLNERVPRFTASIDEALTIMPSYIGDFDIRRRNNFVSKCTLYVASMQYEGRSRSIPLAICIAALRARQEEG